MLVMVMDAWPRYAGFGGVSCLSSPLKRLQSAVLPCSHVYSTPTSLSRLQRRPAYHKSDERSSIPLFMQNLIMPSHSCPSFPNTEPASLTPPYPPESAPISEASLPSQSRNVTTNHQSNTLQMTSRAGAIYQSAASESPCQG